MSKSARAAMARLIWRGRYGKIDACRPSYAIPKEQLRFFTFGPVANRMDVRAAFYKSPERLARVAALEEIVQRDLKAIGGRWWLTEVPIVA